MSPESGARVVRALVLIAASVSAGSNARAGLLPVFRWNAGLNGGYTGNVFYSQGKQKVSSYGGTVKLFGSLDFRGAESSYGGSYRTSYQSYSGKQATDLNSLSHTLTLSMNQRWSQNTKFLASAKGVYTPEQNPFLEQLDSTDFSVNVRPRAQKTTISVSGGWNVETSPTQELKMNFSWGTAVYGDQVSPPAPPGVVNPPPQPFVDQNSFKGSGSFQWEVADKRRVDLTGSWAHLTFDQTIVNYARIDKNGDGTVDAYRETGRTNRNYSTDSLTLTSGFSWELTELTRGTVGLGLLGSDDYSGVKEYTWALSMAVNEEFSPRVFATFGASRDQGTFDGIGGASIGTRAFANFQFDISLKTKLKSTASYSRSESQIDTSSRTDYLKATIVFNQTLGKWGGYNIAYAYNDQQTTGDFVNVSSGRTRFDLIAFGLNFDPSKFTSQSGGGKQK